MKVSMDTYVTPNSHPPDIWISMGLHTIYIVIIILNHFGLLSMIIWTMERRGVVDTVAVALTA
jgi:hypothetical protein